jgi:Flp pilus assembly protein TadD
LAAKGDTNRAIGLYEQARLIETNFALAHEHLANAWGARGSWANAVDEWREVIRIEPDSAEAYHQLGLVESRLGRDADAARELRHAAQLAPRDEDIQRDIPASGPPK